MADAAQPALFGAWQLSGASHVNGARPLGTPELLVPDPSGSAWRLGQPEGEQAGTFALVPLDEEREGPLVAAASIGHRWAGRLVAGDTWEALTQGVSPLDPDLATPPRADGFEDLIDRGLPHLQVVCHAPREWLATEEVYAPVGRARRVSPRAQEHLASHPEDWAFRSVDRVTPRRVRTLAPLLDYNLYENRVAAALVDALIAHLGPRVHRLQEQQTAAEELKKLTGGEGATRQLQWRLAHLQAQLFRELDGAEGTAAHAERARVVLIEHLSRLLRQARALRGSLLYTEVPPEARASVRSAPQLHQTNLFLRHEHYRQVGLLWRAWAVRHRRQAASASKHADDMRALARGLDAYVAMLVVRALGEAGFAPVPGQMAAAFAPGGPAMRLHSRRGGLALFWEASGALRLEAPSTARPLRFVGVGASVFGEAPHAESARARLVSEAQAAHALTRVVVVSGAYDVREQRDPDELVAVGPLDALSVERVAQALHGWFLPGVFAAYPARVQLASSVSRLLAPLEGFRQVTEGVLALITLPDRAAIEGGLDQYVRSSNGQGAAVLADARREAEHARTALRTATAVVEAVLACPVCQSVAAPRALDARDGDFQCTCSSCQALWEVRARVGEATRVAVVEPGGLRRLSLSAPTDGGLPATIHVVGRDVLAPFVKVVADGPPRVAPPAT